MGHKRRRIPHAAVLIIQALRGQPNVIGMPLADAVLFLIRADEKAPINSVRLQMAFGLTPAKRGWPST